MRRPVCRFNGMQAARRVAERDIPLRAFQERKETGKKQIAVDSRWEI